MGGVDVDHSGYVGFILVEVGVAPRERGLLGNGLCKNQDRVQSRTAGGLKTQRYRHRDIEGRNRAKEAPVVRLFPGYNSADPVYNMLRATGSM